MRKLFSRFALGLNLGLLAFSLSEPIAVKAQNRELSCEGISKTVPLYYFREPEKIKTILDAFKGIDPNLKNITVINPTHGSDVILYGCESEVKQMERILATLDLPLQGITMEMWGIQISSSNPEKLGQVMIEINNEINKTQSLMKATYRELEKMVVDIELDPTYENILRFELGYLAALRKYKELSIADMLLLIGGAEDPHGNALLMRGKMEELFNQPQYQDYVKYLSPRGQQPFERFLQAVGLEKIRNNDCEQKILAENCWIDHHGLVDADEHDGHVMTPIQFNAIKSKETLLRFAIDYAYSRHYPNDFDGQRLQETSEDVNTRLQLLVDAINKDVADLFIEPTLDKIQEIVRKHKGVEYAVVGKTSVAGLDGSESTITSDTVSAFEENPPLRLNELLTEIKTVQDILKEIDLIAPIPPETITKVADGVPNLIESRKAIVSILAALSKDRSVWRTLNDGVSLTVTPNILRNASSAELNFDITFSPQQGSAPEPQGSANNSEPKVRPLSRIAKQTVKTKVYVDTFDLFALSTFIDIHPLNQRL